MKCSVKFGTFQFKIILDTGKKVKKNLSNSIRNYLNCAKINFSSSQFVSACKFLEKNVVYDMINMYL